MYPSQIVTRLRASGGDDDDELSCSSVAAACVRCRSEVGWVGSVQTNQTCTGRFLVSCPVCIHEHSELRWWRCVVTPTGIPRWHRHPVRAALGCVWKVERECCRCRRLWEPRPGQKGRRDFVFLFFWRMAMNRGCRWGHFEVKGRDCAHCTNKGACFDQMKICQLHLHFISPHLQTVSVRCSRTSNWFNENSSHLVMTQRVCVFQHLWCFLLQ